MGIFSHIFGKKAPLSEVERIRRDPVLPFEAARDDPVCDCVPVQQLRLPPLDTKGTLDYVLSGLYGDELSWRAGKIQGFPELSSRKYLVEAIFPREQGLFTLQFLVDRENRSVLYHGGHVEGNPLADKKQMLEVLQWAAISMPNQS